MKSINSTISISLALILSTVTACSVFKPPQKYTTSQVEPEQCPIVNPVNGYDIPYRPGSECYFKAMEQIQEENNNPASIWYKKH